MLTLSVWWLMAGPRWAMRLISLMMLSACASSSFSLGASK